MSNPSDPNKRKFPVMMECGTISHVTLHADDKADIEYVRAEHGDTEVVVRLRLKCRHPVHAKPHTGEVEA